MQIPTEYGEDYMVLAVSVGLATIGVCVFSAVASVAALFILILFHVREKRSFTTFI
jgi:hypothetical protein